MKSFVHAAVAATLVVCPSFAVHAEQREQTSIRVRFADLDMTSAQGRAQFESRLDRAIQNACIIRRSDSRLSLRDTRCEAEMMRDAQIKLARIDQRAAMRLASR